MISCAALRRAEGLIFDIDTFAVHDGPGVRMAVFLKGCPLSCRWCHSPESRRPEPEVIFLKDRCTRCGTCVGICPRQVHQVDSAGHAIRRDRCVVCGQCARHCPAGALQVKGYTISAARVVERAVRMKPFFDHSGGGVTLTGGEVACQADFAAAVLQGCRTRGIHTAIETSGECEWPVLERLVERTDLVLYDLKLIDDDAHRRWTGVANGRILENARRLAGRNVEVRVPLIPRITDTEDNLRGLFGFVREAGLRRVRLLPYNPSAAAKYEWLGLAYAIEGEPQDKTTLAALCRLAHRAGLEAAIG